jgi:hypothetical protein
MRTLLIFLCFPFLAQSQIKTIYFHQVGYCPSEQVQSVQLTSDTDKKINTINDYSAPVIIRFNDLDLAQFDSIIQECRNDLSFIQDTTINIDAFTHITKTFETGSFYIVGVDGNGNEVYCYFIEGSKKMQKFILYYEALLKQKGIDANEYFELQREQLKVCADN